jgi:outer membrane protein OmpA-like peptidoglycan-associated protein
MKKMLPTLLTAVVLILTSCSSKPPKGNEKAGANPTSAKAAPPLLTPSMEAKQLANEEQTSLVTEFAFQKGSNELTPTSKEKLKDLTKKAMKQGKIDSIKVISWSDKEYPAKAKGSLSDTDKNLAKNRNEEIKNYLKNLFKNNKRDEDARIDQISMAEKPGWFDNLTKTDNARIKKSLETAGIPSAKSKAKVKADADAKSGKSIVLILMDKNRE